METRELRNFRDLSEEQQKKVKEKVRKKTVKQELDLLSRELKKGEITEEEYFDQLGCSKQYAKQTPWFLRASYYKEHEEEIEELVREKLAEALFDDFGNRAMFY